MDGLPNFQKRSIETLESAIRDVEMLHLGVEALRDDSPIPKLTDSVLLLADNLHHDLKGALLGQGVIPGDELALILVQVKSIFENLSDLERKI